MKQSKSVTKRHKAQKSPADKIAPPTRAAALRKKAKADAESAPAGHAPQAAPASEGLIRNRVRELRMVKASELQANPMNWRTHPQEQRDAMRGILAEVGYAGAVLARETPEGGLMLIDGHLRADLTPDQEVPVLVLDVDEAEAAKILATFDPLSAMAGADAAKLDDVLRLVSTGSEALAEMLDDLAKKNAIVPPEEPGAPLADKYTVVVECKSQKHQTELLEQFQADGLTCRGVVS